MTLGNITWHQLFLHLTQWLGPERDKKPVPYGRLGYVYDLHNRHQCPFPGMSLKKLTDFIPLDGFTTCMV
jgi:hypothetical protein